MAYYLSASSGAFGSWILSGTTLARFDGVGGATTTQYLPRNTLVFPELLAVVPIASTILQANVSVLLVFYPTFVQMYEADTGSYISAVNFAAQCPASSGSFSVSSPIAAGAYVFFQDTYCLYRVDPYAAKVLAVTVGSPGGIIATTTALFSQDQSIIVVAVNGGTLFGVDTSSMAILWYSDAVDRLVTYTTSNSFLLMPSTPFRTLTAPGSGLSPKDEFFIVSTTLYSFAFRFFNGDLLWLQNVPSTTIANVTTDGALLIASTTNLTKYATDVNHPQGKPRQLWTVAIPNYAYFLTQLGQSNIVVVVVYEQAIAFDLTTGAQLWTFVLGTCEGTAQPIPVFDASRSATLPPMVAVGCGSIHMLDASTGSEVYLAVSDTGATYTYTGVFGAYLGALGESTVFAALVEPIVFNQLLPLPAPAVPSSNTIPPGFNFVTPSPTTTPAKTNPINTDFFSPLRTWNVPSQCVNCEIQTTGYTITYQSKQALVAISPFYDYSKSTYNSTLSVNNVIDGQVLYARNLSIPSTGTYVSWTGILGSSMLLGFVSIDQSSGAYFALSLTQPELPLLFVSDPTSLYPELISLNDVLYVPEHNLACNIFYDEDNEVYGSLCISVLAADRGKAVFQFSCESDSTYPPLPVYDPTTGNVLLVCPIDGEVRSFNAATGKEAWGATVEATFAVLSGSSFVVAGIDTDASSCTFASLSTATGIVVQNSSLQIPASVSNSYILQFELVDASSGLVLLDGLGLYYFTLATGAVKWFFNATGVLAFTTGVDPISGSQAAYVASTNAPSGFIGLDLSTGTTLFIAPAEANFFSSSYTYVLSAAFPPYLLLREDPEGYSYAMNLAKRELLWYAATSSLPLLVNTTYGELLVGSRYDGGLGAYLVSASGYSSDNFYTTSTLVSGKPMPGYSTLLAQTTGGLYALDVASGGLNWGVLLSSDASSTSASSGPTAVSPVFAPIFVPSSGPSVPDQVLFSVSNLRITAVTMQSGAVQFSKYLPYCLGNGVGSTSGSTFGGTVDGVYALITVGNLCLYAVNMDTHDISLNALPSLIATAAPPVIAGDCVVVVDQFGSFFCFPRPSLSSSLSATATWTYQTGYASSAVQMQAYGSLFIIAHGNAIHCLSLADKGQLVFRMNVGFSPVFATFGNLLVVLSSTAAYGISLDPTAATRVAWSVTLSDLGVQSSSSPALIVTNEGIAVITVYTGFMGLRVLGAGSVAFNQSTYYEVTALGYSNTPNIFGRVFAVGTQSTIFVADATTGNSIFILPGEVTSTIVDGVSGSIINTVSSTTSVNVLPPAYLQQATAADPQTPVPTQAAPSGTLPPGFTPQGVFNGIPSLPPGVVLPKLGCILNIESLYNGLVACVNSALSTIYSNTGVDNVQCAQAAALVGACAQTWITSTQKDCPASLVYLNNILTTLNTSDAFNFCAKSSRCSDGLAGSQAVCATAQMAQMAADGATIYPGFTFPKPADQLPQFTIPSNTGPPTPPGPPPPTNAPPAIENYVFTCLIKATQLRDVPKNFDVLVQQLLVLPQPPTLTYLSGLSGGGDSFTFIFGTDTAAAVLSSQLKNLVVTEYAQVLATLQLKGISYQQYSPGGAPDEGDGGLGTPAIAGISAGAAILLLLAAIAVYKYKSSSSAQKFHVPLNASSGNYSSENMQSMPKMKLETVGAKYGAL